MSDNPSYTSESARELLETMEDKAGMIRDGREWELVEEWLSFSARFLLLESGGERITIKLGTNWAGDTVSYVATETRRVGRLMAGLPSGRVVMPGVLGVATEPPALALEYFHGTPLFAAVSSLTELERSAVLRLCGEAIGAFHAAQEVPDDPRIRVEASRELHSTARRSAVSRGMVRRTEPRLGRARSYRFSPNDFLLAGDGSLVLLDPPHVQKFDYVHRDVASFFMELHRALVGERRPAGEEEVSALRVGQAAFLEGYRDAGGMALDRGEDRWAIELFQVGRVVGVVRGRLRSRLAGPAWRALSWAWWLRRQMSA
jgi:hypothetical protein